MNSTVTFWNWTRERLVPGVFLSEWYKEQQVTFEEGFISSGYPFLVGMPRLRQIRIRTGKTIVFVGSIKVRTKIKTYITAVTVKSIFIILPIE